MQKINPKDFGKVAVLMGGTSPEREISLLSGQNVLQALQQAGVNAYPLDVQENIAAQLTADKPDRAFNILHGGDGENGVMQSILEKLNIPYTGSVVAACQLIMDKPEFNKQLHELGLPTIKSLIRKELTDKQKIIDTLGFPMCAKPAHSGSSLGVSKVNNIDELQPAFDLAKQYYSEVILQPWIEGPELTVGILDHASLPSVEIRTKRTFYDYQAKYIDDDTQYICPAPLTAEKEQEIGRLALQAYQAVGARHWARVDFKQDHAGKFWILEMNPAPGMTSHS
jgi:D-alanine-D-alanine ligase